MGRNMAETTTHNILRLLVDLANGEGDKECHKEILLHARQETRGMDRFINPTGNEPVLRILQAISRGVLDQASNGLPTIVYGEQVSSLGFQRENGLFSPVRLDTTASFRLYPGWGLDGEKQEDVQVAFRMFGYLVSGGLLSPERVGKCPCPLPMKDSEPRLCGRYFLSLRLGQKKSRACSKAHQAVLIAKELRDSPKYREKENARNARRMAAVREAEKRVAGWKKEGKTKEEVLSLLWTWNKENGSILKKRAFFNILEKGV